MLMGCRAASAEILFSAKGDASQSTGLPIYQWSDPAVSAKATVIIVHGLTQEAASPQVLAEDLAKHHYLVLSLDQRGHGRRRDGTFKKGKTVDYRQSLDDLRRLCLAARSAHPYIPVICIGESAGSSVIVQSARKDPKLMDGMVLSSAGTRPRVFNLTWLIPDFLSNIGRLNHPVDLRRYISKYASNDPQIIAEMVSDPLNRNFMSGHELVGTMKFIWLTRFAAKHVSSETPLLMVQGAKDNVLMTYTIRPLFNRFSSTDKKLVLFPQYGHVLLGTKYIQKDVVQTVESWLDNQVGRNGTGLITQKIEPSAPIEFPTNIQSNHAVLNQP